MRKLVPVGFLGLLLALVVAGCGGSGSGGTVSLETGETTNAACEASPVSGGNLVYARQYEAVTLNPYEVLNGAGDIWAYEMIYSNLVRLNPEGTNDEIVPGLAKSWDVSPDGKTYTFHLRPGLKFSDGTPITAEDVKWSLENFGNPKVNEVMSVLIGGYQETKILDPSTIQVKLSVPTAAFLYDIAEWPAVILPKEQVESGGEAFWKHPVGAGPFIVKEYVQGSHISFERNPYYFENGKPYLKTMRWNFALEGNSRVLSLKSGQAQIADGIPYSQIPALQADPNLVVQKTVVPAWIDLSLNNEYKPLGDVNVRAAMNYALNREEINRVVFKGVGEIPNSMFGHLKLDGKDVKAVEYNLAKAKEYMAKSKYPKGFSLTIQYPTGFEFYKQMTLLIQQELGEIGIKVKLEELAATAVVEHWIGLEYQSDFPFPVTSSDIPIPDEMAGFYALPGGTNGFGTAWSDPTIAKKVETFQTTPDEATRAKQWPVIQQELLEQSPAINVMDVPFVSAHADNVCGTAINGVGADRLEYTWIAPNSGN
jgi:peptide/nickel transport system substrate-binding protein